MKFQKSIRQALSEAIYIAAQCGEPAATARAIALHMQNELGLEGEQLKAIREGVELVLSNVPINTPDK